ncbi:hypothetical protein GGH92_004065 [Coemansia sp. RSA 2673]|nr:hypothetical protein GGH92_004065 [Coemansia sp. RSA 2673]
MVIICVISSLAIIYLTVVHHVLDNYIIVRWARDTTTLFEYFAGQTPLFILLRVPVYNCIFNRVEYQRQFYRKMHADGMAAVYGFANNPSFDRHLNTSTTLAYPALPPAPAIRSSAAADGDKG